MATRGLRSRSNSNNTLLPHDKSKMLAGDRRVLGDLGNVGRSHMGPKKTAKSTKTAHNPPRRSTRTRDKQQAKKKLQAIVGTSFAAPPVPVPEPEPIMMKEEETIPMMDDEEDVQPMQLDDEPYTNLSLQDIDEYDKEDPQFCTEYVEEIFEFLRQKEADNRVDPDYMKQQPDLCTNYRSILVMWMSEVYVKFRLLSETMFLAVNIVDRFLMARPVSRARLQLVGATSLLIACKFEEIYLPTVGEFAHLCADAYTREEFLRMERIILSTLCYNLAVPTPLHFLRRFSKAAFSSNLTHSLSKYITELTLDQYELLKYLPSEIAAATVLVARNMVGISPLWNSTLRHYTGYHENDLYQCAQEINQVVIAAYTAKKKLPITRKYSDSRLLRASTIAAVPLP